MHEQRKQWVVNPLSIRAIADQIEAELSLNEEIADEISDLDELHDMFVQHIKKVRLVATIAFAAGGLLVWTLHRLGGRHG